MSAAPIRFELGDEVIECKPLPFGEACLWREEMLGLYQEMNPDTLKSAQITREEVEKIQADIEAESPDATDNWKAEETARRAGDLAQRKMVDSISTNAVESMRRIAKFSPRMLDMVCRYARVGDEQRQRLEEQMGNDLQRGIDQVNDALAICGGASNPSAGVAAEAAAPVLNGLAKSI